MRSSTLARGAPRAFLLYVLAMSTFVTMSAELEFVEGFSGDYRVTKAFRTEGYVAAHYDVRRIESMDILASEGGRTSLLLDYYSWHN